MWTKRKKGTGNEIMFGLNFSFYSWNEKVDERAFHQKAVTAVTNYSLVFLILIIITLSILLMIIIQTTLVFMYHSSLYPQFQYSCAVDMPFMHETAWKELQFPKILFLCRKESWKRGVKFLWTFRQSESCLEPVLPPLVCVTRHPNNKKLFCPPSPHLPSPLIQTFSAVVSPATISPGWTDSRGLQGTKGHTVSLATFSTTGPSRKDSVSIHFYRFSWCQELFWNLLWSNGLLVRLTSIVSTNGRLLNRRPEELSPISWWNKH